MEAFKYNIGSVEVNRCCCGQLFLTELEGRRITGDFSRVAFVTTAAVAFKFRYCTHSLLLNCKRKVVQIMKFGLDSSIPKCCVSIWWGKTPIVVGEGLIRGIERHE